MKMNHTNEVESIIYDLGTSVLFPTSKALRNLDCPLINKNVFLILQNYRVLLKYWSNIVFSYILVPSSVFLIFSIIILINLEIV